MVDLQNILLELQPKLMSYAMTFVNVDDAEDLCQSTLLKIMENSEQFLQAEHPPAYAKKSLRNLFFDKYRKESRLTGLEENLEPAFSVEPKDHLEHQLFLFCLEKQDEVSRTILSLRGTGHNYKEIREFIDDLSLSSLRGKAYKARIALAECMGKTNE